MTSFFFSFLFQLFGFLRIVLREGGKTSLFFLKFFSLATARFGLFDRPGRTTNRDTTDTIGRSRRRAHAIFDFSRHRHEGLFNVGPVLSRRLQEWNFQFLCVFLLNNREDYIHIKNDIHNFQFYNTIHLEALLISIFFFNGHKSKIKKV